MMLTYRYRIKDSTAKRQLSRYAWACNQVWNYCCQIQREAETRWKQGLNRKWPTAIDLSNLCIGGYAELGIHSDTITAICRQFVVSRNAKRRCPKFRVSGGPRRSLGWIPVIWRAIKVDGDSVTYLKRRYRFWKKRDISGKIKTGSFSEDARGRWYISLQCELDDNLTTGSGEVGIDLGLKDIATISTGAKIPALPHYRSYQASLGIAQRAKNKKRVKAIHAKIANSRRHHLHVASSAIARDNRLIVVGNVNAAALAKTRMAKSVLDASWSMFRNQLRYKASRHGAVYLEVDERFTSQTCSRCGCIPASSPKGMGALGIRRWECSECGASHDRDVNAAVNILRVGLEQQPLAVGNRPHKGSFAVTP